VFASTRCACSTSLLRFSCIGTAGLAGAVTLPPYTHHTPHTHTAALNFKQRAARMHIFAFAGRFKTHANVLACCDGAGCPFGLVVVRCLCNPQRHTWLYVLVGQERFYRRIPTTVATGRATLHRCSSSPFTFTFATFPLHFIACICACMPARAVHCRLPPPHQHAYPHLVLRCAPLVRARPGLLPPPAACLPHCRALRGASLQPFTPILVHTTLVHSAFPALLHSAFSLVSTLPYLHFLHATHGSHLPLY